MKKNDFLIQYFEKRKSKIFKLFLFSLLVFFLFFLFNNKLTPKNFVGKIHLEGIINDKSELINQLNDIEIYNILDRKIINFQFEKNLDNQIYNVCLSEKNINQVINIFNSYIINESREDFLKFIYEKK